MDKYSVLMSVYDKVKEEELELSISSMMNQTIVPEQFVIVFDGPVSDNIRRVINKFVDLYPEVFTIVEIPINQGLAYALNVGLKQCRNELIARMDSDDYSLPKRCEKQLNEFEKDSDLVILGTMTQNFINVPENIQPLIKKRPTEFNEIKKALRRNSPFAHPSVMYKKSKVLACGGYDPELRRRQDYDLFSKMVNGEGNKAKNLSEVLLLFRTEENYFIRNKSKESCTARLIVQKRIYKRKECTFIDYMYIKCAMVASMLLPTEIYKKVLLMIKTKSDFTR